jgi:hypothetical protein
MKRRMIFSAIAGSSVAFLASLVAFITSHGLLTYAKEMDLDMTRQHFIEILEKHRSDTGAFPEHLSELHYQGKQPFDVDEQGRPLDPWGTPYIYERQGDSFLMQSLGSDGQHGGRGTKADITFSPDAEEWVSMEPMSYWEFIFEQPTTLTVATSALAGIFTFFIGACGAIRQKRDDEPIATFIAAIVCVSAVSMIVGGIVATWHVQIGEHHKRSRSRGKSL